MNIFSKYMNAEILESSKTEINLSITQTDIATLYIVQHELLGNSNVEFAGVIVKHPLTNECWMKITSTKNNPPVQEITKAADSAIKHAEDLKKLFNSNIQVS